MAKIELYYGIEKRPPIHVALLLGLQHFIIMFGGTVTLSQLLSDAFCMAPQDVARSNLLGTIVFVSGVMTLLQCTLGIRLPIVQGGTIAFFTATVAILSLPKWRCPSFTDDVENNQNMADRNNTTLIVDEPIWKSRMREIQGAIIVASLFQVIVGATGLVGFMLRFIGPLTIAPILTLIGASIAPAAAHYSAKQWWIATLTAVLVTVFAQYLRNVRIPCFKMAAVANKRRVKCMKTAGCRFFSLFPIILAMAIVWFICFLLTVTNLLPNDPGSWGYDARTDIRMDLIYQAQWFRFPYPFQWGIPTVSVAGVFGILAGVLAGLVESIGEYHINAKFSGAPPPPIHAVNRGVFIEGICCILSGIWGTGNGTTSHSTNTAVIGITKVASRFVIQMSAIIMICLGMFGKFGALFMTIPDPVMGGVLIVICGMIVAVGISNLQYVDLNSSRNLYIFGLAIFVGLCLPRWVSDHPGCIDTGVSFLDQLFTVICTTSMFVGGAISFILDNTIPGTEAERGISTWSKQISNTAPLDDGSKVNADEKEKEENDKDLNDEQNTYDLPFGMALIRHWKWTRFIPISPTFQGTRTKELRETALSISNGKGIDGVATAV